jgi:hypothetical protein
MVSADVIASALGHVLMHTAAILHGSEVPPVIRTITIALQECRAGTPLRCPRTVAGRRRALLHRRS